MALPLEGGCLCGAVRYRITLPPLDTGYCHCRMCQRSSGGPVQASAEIPIAGFALIKGELKAYRSSPGAVRHFCPHCGTSVFWEGDKNPATGGVAVGCFADPDFPPPDSSGWEEAMHSWLGLPPEIAHFPQSRS